MKFFGPALVLAVSLGAGTAVKVYGAPPGVEAAAWQPDAVSGINPLVFALALQATQCAVRSADVPALPRTLTIIDYSKPSTVERLWVFDLATRGLLYRELVAHGQGSGENLASHFSNNADSHQSSLGLFLTEDTYVGKNGYSLRLRGLEAGVNDHAYERAIVMHGAPYVSAEFASQQGRLGRSWGCPALRTPIAREVIDRIKSGGAVFAYANDADWLRTSKFLNSCTGPAVPQAFAAF